MPTFALRTAVFVLAVAIPTTGAATERRSSLLSMRAQEPMAPKAAPIELLPPAPDPPAAPVEPAVEDVPSDPPPEAVPTATEPAREFEPVWPATDREAIYAAARAEGTRDIGASAMVGTGLTTVGGVVLILAGFGATAAAVRKSDCDDNQCATTDRKVVIAARVTLAGLAISTIGALGFIAAAAVYGVGNARVQRTRGASVPAIALAPAQRGAALSIRGRF